MARVKTIKKDLLPKERVALIVTLEARFKKNMNRHSGLDWAKVQKRKESKGDKLLTLSTVRVQDEFTISFWGALNAFSCSKLNILKTLGASEYCKQEKSLDYPDRGYDCRQCRREDRSS